MKYFTPLVRSLVLAFGLLALSGSAKAQLSCGLDPNNIEITVQSTCDATNPSILFNFGSFFINGPVTVEFKTFYFNGFFSFPQNSVIEVNAVNGFAIGEFPPNAPPVVATNNFVRLISVSIENVCFQDFTADEVDSNLFDIGTVPSIDADETTVVVEDAPCDNVPTGQIDIFFVPFDGNTSNPNRFSATRTDFGLVNVFAPGEFPNPSSTEYLARATNLLPGDYTILIFDVATGCETAFTETVEGEFSLTVTASPASCFGEADGSLTLIPDGADPNVNGNLFFVIEGPISAAISGSIAASVNGYPNRTINNLPAGTYQISISDSNGNCTLTETAVIGQPAEITVGFLFAPPICADANSYTVEVAAVAGLNFNVQNASYDIIDPSPNSGCWGPYQSSMRPFPAEMNGGYSLTGFTPGTGFCRPLNQDTTVNLELVLFNNFTGCTDTFPFVLQVNAQPVDPMVEVFSILGTGDSVVGGFFCSNQDVEVNIPNYDPLNTYEITYTGTAPGTIDTMGDFNAMSIPYTGDGSVIGSFQNNANFAQTIELQVVSTNILTGCSSEPTAFSIPVRPNPEIDPIFDLNPIVCSAQDYDLSVFLNDNGGNQNVRYDFQWSFSSPLVANFSTISDTDQTNGSSIYANFTNQSGEDQTATLTITPTFPQNSQTIGGPFVDNSCSGEPVVVTLTVQPQPSLTADLEIGDDVMTTLMSGDAVAYEICSGDNFLLDNLNIPEPSGAKLKYVIFDVQGDAGFLNIPTPTTQFLPIDNFLIGVQNVMNNSPDNSAQVATITLTPYFEMFSNMSASQSGVDCEGESITLVLTVNPLPPALNSPQMATFCSEERVDYVIGGASGMGDLETRISEFNTFENETDFVVPAGAARIEDFSFTLSGGNGGGTAGAGPNRSGGRGGVITGSLSELQLLPGDTVRVRRGTAGSANVSNGNGGNATTMVVIRPGSGIVHTFVAAGGGGAGVAFNGQNASIASTNSSPADGTDGQGPGGFGGTGFPDAMGGAGQGNGGGGGGGWIGGDGGNSQSGAGGQGGDSYSSTGSVGFSTKPFTQDADGEAQVFYTVVYDDIRFDLVSKTVDPGLTDQSEPIVDGEVDTILFGQQFLNPTNGPLDVTYVFSTRTEADCTDGSTVEVVLTIEPEATAELASNGTTVMGSPENGYTATICSGDSLSAYLFSMATPTGGDNQLRYTTSFTTSSGDVTIVGSDPARASSGIPGASGGNRASQDSVLFFEEAILNSSAVAQTVTYTITPFINRPGQPNCPGTPFTFTVTVNPGFFGVATPGQVEVCSRDVFSDEGFDLQATQPNLNIDFSTVRLVDYRVSTTDPNFTAISAVDTSGLAAGGVLLTETNGFFNNDSYRNRTGSGVTVEYDIRLVSDDGCQSEVITYSFLVRAEPIIDETMADFRICTGDEVGMPLAPTANSAFASSFTNTANVTFDYELSLETGLVFVGGSPYPVLGAGSMEMVDDIIENPTNSPLVATYTVTATTRFGCTSEVATFNVTVDPDPEIQVIATHAGTSINAEMLLADVDTLTICSGGQITFSPSQNVVGTDVLYRVNRNVDNAPDVVDGNSMPIDLFEGGLEFVDVTEVLINNGNTAQYVLYSFAAYTFGPDGIDGNGLNASDDCRGVFKRLRVEVLPNPVEEDDLQVNQVVDGTTFVPSGTQICDGTDVSVRPFTLIDPNSTGIGFTWTRENDGTLLDGATSGQGTFNPNGSADMPPRYFTALGDRINQQLVAQDDVSREVRYIISLYTFGSNGIDEGGQGDDCIGDVDTASFLLDPTPVLSYDIQIGTEMDNLTADGSPYTYEICSGEDFLINNLMIPQLADGKANYVEMDVDFDATFIGIPSGFDVGVFPAASFSVGAQNVQTTLMNNSAQTARITLTPYFEDGVDDQTLGPDECSGEPIVVIVTLNPTPPDLGPFETTVCSEDRIEYQIPGASDVGGTFRSRVASSFDFSEGNEYVVPPGVWAIRGINLSLSGANGGDRTAQNRGGLGYEIEATINPFNTPRNNLPVQPGDTIRVRKGEAGAANFGNGDGGDATLVCVIAGPNNGNFAEGDMVAVFVAAGGGGAGFAEIGDDATEFTINPNDPTTDGLEGAGLGGFGGTGWNAMNPASGSLGGAGRGNGGGGGGGWSGGDGGSNLDGAAGEAGESYAGTAGPTPIVINSNGTKNFNDAPAGDAFMTFTLVFNDVRFSLLERSVAEGLIDISDNPIVDGETDTILFGERFDNPTDGPLDVNYVFTTSSEAECPGGTVEVTITVEPTPTLQLASGRTTITQDGMNEYSATICSRDSLDAVLSSSTMPSEGVNFLRARVIDVDVPAGVVIGGNNPARASEPNGQFGGPPNDRAAAAPIPFFETRIINNNDVPADVVYTVVPRIVGGDEVCFGDTLTLTVTVQPGFPGIDLAPAQVNVCSNVSFEDSGFDIAATQSFNNGFMIEQIRILSVTDDAGGDPNFETISSVYSGMPVSVDASVGGFGGDTYRNRTGGPVVVTYVVEFINGDDCASRPVTYTFRMTAEPIIDATESVSNIIDTIICSTATTGLQVDPAPNSAFAGSFGSNIDLMYEIDLPDGVLLSKANGSYPATPASGRRTYFENDELVNTTNAPLDVVYTVTPSNGGCLGDPVEYTVTVNPEPFADVMLTSMDSTATFGLDNAEDSVSPTPEFGVCSGQALHVNLPGDSLSTPAGGGMTMVNVRVIDPDGLTDFTNNVPFTIPLSELGDTLSFEATELTNTTAAPMSFTVRYNVFFEYDGVAGRDESMGDCDIIGTVEFVVVVNPVNAATIVTRNPNVSGDILCSGETFNLRVQAVNTTPTVDSFLIRVHADEGLEAVAGTEGEDFWIFAPFTGTNFRRDLNNRAFTNSTFGNKSVTYTAIPYTAGCPGDSSMTTVTYRPEVDLELALDGGFLCAPTGVATAVQLTDANGNMLSTDRNEYRWEYLGGTAANFTIAATSTANPTFIFDPMGQAGLVVNNRLEIFLAPQAGLTGETAIFEVIYDDVAGCGVVTDTVTVSFSTDVSAGIPDPTLGVQCDGVNFILFDALLAEDEGGEFFFANGDPIPGSPNFTPMIGGSSLDPVSVDFIYVVGGGNSGCTLDTTEFSIEVEPAPNAGAYVGTPGEACQDAPFFNLFDLIPGAMAGGTFTQTGGVDFVTVNGDGTFDQSTVSPGIYTFSYEVMSNFGCGSDIETGIAVEVVAREECSVVVPCDVITLRAGANVISFDVIPSDNSVQSIFADLIATQNLLQVVSVQPDVNNGDPELFVFLSGLGFYAGNITGGLQGGYGYVVTVAQDATVEVCGTPVDEDLRVALQEDLNIVAYVPQMAQSADTYFNTLNQTGQLDFVRTAVGDVVTQRFYNTSPFPFPFGNLTQVQNGLGYVVNVGAAIGADTWKRNGFRTTANFDHFYGVVENGKQYVGQTIQFVDADGNLFGTTTVRDEGIYYGELAYGDIANTDAKEGFAVGEEVFMVLDGQTYATGLTFSGNWGARRFDLNPGTVDVEEVLPTTDLETTLTVFPNPTFGPVSVEFTTPMNHREAILSVFNAMGQIVFEQKVNEVAAGQHLITFDVNELPAGTYQLILSSEAGLIGRKQFIRK
ncbi:PKD-like domain-containing protein [Lewinella sp. W8]|uniref:PKD-like domain-containing protein n=1 Tax=Lewinella sp. W8 TaxID=2528208 RepID=UPI001067B98D|nr:PKD-like domain-containing protein [Lewinella sp. W8]MTB52841.1 hypothetical protein [Lewinella sp. W8]